MLRLIHSSRLAVAVSVAVSSPPRRIALAMIRAAANSAATSSDLLDSETGSLLRHVCKSWGTMAATAFCRTPLCGREQSRRPPAVLADKPPASLSSAVAASDGGLRRSGSTLGGGGGTTTVPNRAPYHGRRGHLVTREPSAASGATWSPRMASSNASRSVASESYLGVRGRRFTGRSDMLSGQGSRRQLIERTPSGVSTPVTEIGTSNHTSSAPSRSTETQKWWPISIHRLGPVKMALFPTVCPGANGASLNSTIEAYEASRRK